MSDSDNKLALDVKESKLEQLESSENETVDVAVDNAKRFVDEREQLYGEISEEEIKKTVRKNDWILLPLLFFTATMGAVDKVSLSTAALYGLRTDANLKGQEYSWLGSIIFIGSVVGVWPMTYVLQRYRLGIVYPLCSLIWSAFTLLLPACNNYAGLVAMRFIMGIVETAIVPGATLMVGRFYKKHEQPVRLSLVFMFGSSVINGFLSWLVGNFGTSIPRWKSLWLLVGSISFSWSILMFFLLPSSPMSAVYLNDRQKYIMAKRVLENHTGVETNDFKWYQAREALLDIKAYVIFFFNVGINIPNGGLNTFNGIIISNLGFDAKKSSLMTIPTGVVASLSTVIFNYFGGKYENKRCILAVTALLVPIVGAAICYGVDRSKVGPQLLGLYLMYFYFAPYVTMMSLAQANTSGNTKKSVVYGMNYLGYAVGALIGPQTFRANQAPKYTGGFIAMLASYCACICFAVLYWFICTIQNKNKAALLAKDTESLDAEIEQEKAYMDLTDKQKKDFMYTK